MSLRVKLSVRCSNRVLPQLWLWGGSYSRCPIKDSTYFSFFSMVTISWLVQHTHTHAHTSAHTQLCSASQYLVSQYVRKTLPNMHGKICTSFPVEGDIIEEQLGRKQNEAGLCKCRSATISQSSSFKGQLGAQAYKTLHLTQAACKCTPLHNHPKKHWIQTASTHHTKFSFHDFQRTGSEAQKRPQIFFFKYLHLKSNITHMIRDSQTHNT